MVYKPRNYYKLNILLKLFFYSFINCFIILLLLGAKLASEPYIIIAQLLTFYYFFYLIFLIPTTSIVISLTVRLGIFMSVLIMYYYRYIC
jgi:hypothetical protein